MNHVVGRVWRLLTEPHPAVRARLERQQAQTLAIVQLPLFIVIPALYMLRDVGFSTFARPAMFFTLLIVVASFVAYCASRTRYYRVGVYVLVAGLLQFVIGTILVERTATSFEVMTLYFALAVLIASLFLSTLATSAIAILTLAALVWLASVAAPGDTGILVNQVRYLGILYVLILASTYVRSRHEREVVESEARYRSLFEATIEPLLIVRDGKVVDGNFAIWTLSGYTPDDLRGRAIADLMLDEQAQPFMQRPQNDPSARYELTFVSKDGRKIPIELIERPYVYQGQSVRVMSMRDLTAMRQAESQRMELSLVNERQAVQQQLLRHLSHDFRTPLSVIKTSLYLLERTTHDAEKHQRHVESVRLQADRLQEMIDDFLMLVRLDHAPRAGMGLGTLKLSGLLEKIAGNYRPQMAERGIHFTVALLPTLPEMPLDEVSFQRIMKSLLTNALYFTGENGSVHLEAATMDGQVVIKVRDTGIGISESDLPHIFEHFYRADQARGTDNGGTGLGLTIARKTARQMGGDIQVESEVGAGSVFTLTLPIAMPQAAEEALQNA
jgi:PAS domain S-box-containing protein